MRCLICGCTGFAGSHLAEYALNMGADVWGNRRWRSPMDNVTHIEKDIKWTSGDLTDPSAVRKILEESKPDWVFGLAAQSYVPASFSQPRETFHTNVQSQINLLHGLKEGLCGRFLSIGSSEEYGMVMEDEVPIKETNPLRPLSPYGVSKCATDLLAYQYHQSYKLHIVRSRAFNHFGPRRGEVFVASSFAKQIAEIEAGLKPAIIWHGNLNAIRDFTDVRDIVEAYWLLLDQGEPGEVYNIASGRGWKIEDVLRQLVGMSTRKDIVLEKDPKRMRPSDVPILIGNTKKIKEDIGWNPCIPFIKTLSDLLSYWRRKIKKS